MKKRIILIPKDDLVYYPPTLSLINVLLKKNMEVVCVGSYSDKERKEALEKAGVSFIPINRDLKDVSKYRIINWIVILWRMRKYTSKLIHYLSSSGNLNDDLIWFIYSNTIGYLQKYIERYDYVVQFYEFENFALNGKERILHPSYDVHKFLSNAKALVHCEYNRAVITNGLYGLNKEVFVLPNKPYGNDNEDKIKVPDDIAKIVEEVKKKINGRKAILYQGIFNASERRLDEFCEAVEMLPENYVFVAMGGGGGYFEEIQKKYNSDKIIYLPFIRPPYHLQITQLAYIGILTYHPANHSYEGVINPLYCAPNKIFEYGKYGIPMIANDVPGLKMIFDKFKCGKTVGYPITPQKISNTIKSMDANYQEMGNGSRLYYDSIDFEEIVSDIIK